MSQTIGPATKAAIARIVAHLPYLKAEGTGVPTASRDGIASIKAKYAAIHADPNGDPMVTAATQWAEEEIQKGLDADRADNTPAPKDKSKKEEAAEGDLTEETAKKGHK